MDKKPKNKNSKAINLFIIAGLVLIAAVLVIASRSFSSPNAGLTKEEIEQKQAALSPTEAPSPTGAPAQAAAVTAAPTEAPVSAEASSSAAYVFIVIDNRVWGIEALGEERDVTVDQGDGVVNVVHIMPDGYYMKSSTCDNQLCVSEGTVTVTNYQRRILGPCVYCLPHNLMLELVVPGATADPSAPDV